MLCQWIGVTHSESPDYQERFISLLAKLWIDGSKQNSFGVPSILQIRAIPGRANLACRKIKWNAGNGSVVVIEAIVMVSVP